jgi:hypothetical protein
MSGSTARRPALDSSDSWYVDEESSVYLCCCLFIYFGFVQAIYLLSS